MSNKTIHEGLNIKRFREMRGLKQEGLATALGDDWTEKKVSLLEHKETIDPAILQKVSEVLEVPVEIIRRFDEDRHVNITTNTFNDQSQLNGYNGYNNFPTYNAVDKCVEALQEIKRLNEALLKAKEQQIADLQKMMADLKK